MIGASRPPQQAGPEPHDDRYGSRYRGRRGLDKAGGIGSVTFARSVGALILFTALPLFGCYRAPAEPTVTKAWVRLSAVPGRPAAAYFTMHGDRTAERLVKIESTLAAKTEMHASMGGGMAPLQAVEVPAGGTVSFAPNGRHAMLFGLDRQITPGTAVPLRFGFASGHTAEAEAKTVPAGDDAPY